MHKQHTVLFVDDEPALLEGLRNALRKEPFEVLTAGSASEGLALLHARRVDVVVSDQRMPGVSGTEFLAFVRQRFPSVVRILLTGQASLEAAIGAINEGEVYRFLTKPCHPALLAQTLRDALLVRSLTRESARLLALHRRRRDESALAVVERDDEGRILLEDLDAEGLLEELRLELGALEERA